MASCTTCNGKGASPRCDGLGKRIGGLFSVTCEVCKGKKVCVTCNGTGRR